jgi:hypothetical protein
MALTNVSPIYISSGCNRCPKALDWGGRHNQIIYAQVNSIALLSDHEPFQIKSTYNSHKDKVNAVKWITSNGFISIEKFKINEFVSASKDKTVIIWQETPSDVNVSINNFESKYQIFLKFAMLNLKSKYLE